MALDKEYCSGNITDLSSYKIEEHSKYHSVLVLTPTVIEYKVELLDMFLITLKETIMKELPVNKRSNVIPSLLPLILKISMGLQHHRIHTTVNHTKSIHIDRGIVVRLTGLFITKVWHHCVLGIINGISSYLIWLINGFLLLQIV